MMFNRSRRTRGFAARTALSICVALLAVSTPLPGAAQSVDDGIVMPKHALLVGDRYSHDSWDQYWEGGLKRDNGNIGTLTTQTNAWFADYGITNRLNVLAMVPRVWTTASQGVLHSMQGFQDATLAAKYAFLDRPATAIGSVRALVAAAGSLPMTDYTPDFYPLSIGSASRRVTGRGTLDVQTSAGWFAVGSGGYTVRGGVTLDRPYYYTNGQLFLTDKVDMPNVLDYTASAGFRKPRLMAAVTWAQQQTRGGGDIRRQDMPFVSNCMNFSKLGGMAMVPVPKARRLIVEVSYAYTVTGRNVGQSTTFATGLLYRVPFAGGRVQ